MQFLYFLPGESGWSDEVARRYGLLGRLAEGVCMRPGSRVFERDGKLVKPSEDGAAAVPGCLVGMGDAEQVRFDWNMQAWEKVEEANGPAYWIGYETKSLPGEIVLRRGEFRGGYQVLLGNGERWCIPPVRRYPEGSGLPSVVHIRPDMTEDREIQAPYIDLFRAIGAVAEPYYAAVRKGPGARGSDDDSLPELSAEILLRLLALNYRIWRAEVNILGLLTDVSRIQITLAAIDWPGFLAIVGREGEMGADPTAG